jgi:diphthine-ammonia ligase
MKFIALISGGKDSVFNIVKCVENGHELVAVLNLYNKDDGQEKDSFMYQTVGTNAVQAIAEALNKPLYRREIKGMPKITSMEYTGEKEGDEVEDLY